ncbi:MAG: hypothetical protein JJ956_17020, partial [Pseudomonadales bacterium]|nr:hypothetical protein [Pseudomonadales bacterium]
MKLSYFVLLLPLLLMAACGGPSEESATDVDEALDNSEELATYYAERPEFFGFKTMADIPADLTWENGDHLAEVGSP